MTVEKTLVFKFNDKSLLVTDLPEAIQNEIATLDRFKQDKINIMYELEKVELATYAKLTQLNRLVEQHFAKKEDVESNKD